MDKSTDTNMERLMIRVRVCPTIAFSKLHNPMITCSKPRKIRTVDPLVKSLFLHKTVADHFRPIARAHIKAKMVEEACVQKLNRIAINNSTDLLIEIILLYPPYLYSSKRVSRGKHPALCKQLLLNLHLKAEKLMVNLLLEGGNIPNEDVIRKELNVLQL